MKPAEFWWRRAVVLWAPLLLLVYLMPLFRWVLPNPLVVKSALPFFGMEEFPGILGFARGLLLFMAGLGVFAAAGHGAGTAVGTFWRMGGMWPGRSIALGFGALGILLLGGGLVGLFYRGVFLAILAVAAAAGVAAAGSLKHSRKGMREFVSLWRRPEFGLPVLLAGWITLLTCLAPETFQDPLRYHFFVPARFLLEHKFVFLERFFYWSYMGPIQMLYGAGLSLAGELWAASVNVLCAFLSLAALYRIGRRAGTEPALLAVALALAATSPGFALVTGATFVEQAMSLCVLLALEAALHPGEALRRRLITSGLFLGLAGSIKYTAFFGAFGLIALFLLGLPAAGRMRWLGVLRGRAAAVAGAIMAPLAPWFAERWLFTRDPISPILARAGLVTMDSSSGPTLEAAYAFARESWVSWLVNPSVLLAYPANFAGAHEGFWEHPGPAIVCLLPAALLVLRRIAGDARCLLAFSGGSAAAWLVFFGGASPHYVSGFFGIWTVSLAGSVAFLPGGGSLVLSNTLRFTVFFQALICVVAMTMRFGPRDVALGAMDPGYYLSRGLAPENVHYPLRRELEKAHPERRTVYVYGDDQSYYLKGRVHLDYENGSDPLIWRLASESSGPGELRKRLKQKNWTHFLYSPRWPDNLSVLGMLEFRHDRRTLELMQEFWRLYVRPTLTKEVTDREGIKASYVFEFLAQPTSSGFRPRFAGRAPFLPGAEALLWRGDRRMNEGELGEAEEEFARHARTFPRFAILQERLARLALMRGRAKEARERLARAAQEGWIFPSSSVPGGPAARTIY